MTYDIYHFSHVK